MRAIVGAHGPPATLAGACGEPTQALEGTIETGESELSAPQRPTFARETAAAGKVLDVEVAGLGDLVHSLPAMAAIRKTYPSAERDCPVRREYASLLALAPWTIASDRSA